MTRSASGTSPCRPASTLTSTRDHRSRPASSRSRLRRCRGGAGGRRGRRPRRRPRVPTAGEADAAASEWRDVPELAVALAAGCAGAAVEPTRWLTAGSSVGLGNPEAEYGGTPPQRRRRRRAAARVAARRAVQAAPRAGAGRRHVRPPGGTPLSLVLPFGVHEQRPAARCSRPCPSTRCRRERLVVVHDDLDLELGRLRLKTGGGTGGHNGLKDVQRRLRRARLPALPHRHRPPAGSPGPRRLRAQALSAPRSARSSTSPSSAPPTPIVDLVTDGLEAAQNRLHPLS